MKKPIKSIGFFYRPDKAQAKVWEKKIRSEIKKHYTEVRIDGKKPQVLIVLGGDGAILEAARKCQETKSTIVGFNLGQLGFLSSVRDQKDFIPALSKLFTGSFHTTDRIMLDASITRKGRKII